MGAYATTIADRFAKFVPTWGSEGCWEWTGSTIGHMGYGQMAFDGRHMLAHRAAYLFYVDDIPEGMIVMHDCDNPLCVRPDHLRLGTVAENQADMVAKGRHRAHWDRVHDQALTKPCPLCGGPRRLSAGRVRCPRGACRGGQ